MPRRSVAKPIAYAGAARTTRGRMDLRKKIERAMEQKRELLLTIYDLDEHGKTMIGDLSRWTDLNEKLDRAIAALQALDTATENKQWDRILIRTLIEQGLEVTW